VAGDAGSSPRAPYKYHPLAVNAPKKMLLLGYKIIFPWWAISPSGRNGRVAAGDAGSSPRAPYKYHPLAVNAPKKMCLLGYKIIFAWWAISPSGRNGRVAAGDAGSSPRAPYKYYPLAVYAPKNRCLLGYKITFAWWTHSALMAEWRMGGRGRRFFTASPVQILSACSIRTKKYVPFGVQNNLFLVDR
jgi:hypothetical protein